MKAKRATQKSHPLSSTVSRNADTKPEPIDDLHPEEALLRYIRKGHTAKLPKGIDESKLSPFGKFYLRYGMKPFVQADADQEFDVLRVTQCKRYLTFLKEEVEDGHINGLRELAYIATEATKLLNKYAEQHPDYVSVVAQDYSFWPVLWNGINSIGKDYNSLISSIGLDSALPNTVPTKLIGVSGSGARELALKLIRTLDSFRLGPLAKRPQKKVWFFRDLCGSSVLEPGVPCHDVLAKAGQLPPWTAASAKTHWWPLARQLLLRLENGKPWERAELKSYKKGFEERNAPGDKRDLVVKHVMSAFFTLAGAKSRKV